MGKIFKEGVVVSFVNQKGGVGKSTLTALFANYLFSECKENGLNLNVAVIDADDRQLTLFRKRERDTQGIENNDVQPLYKVIKMSSADIANNIEFYKDEYDIILLDLPGNMMQEGIITSYFLIDIAIIPFEASEFDFDSTRLYFDTLEKQIIAQKNKSGYKTTVYGLFNKVKANLVEFKNLYAAKDQLPFKMCENYVTDSKVLYQRNINTIGEDGGDSYKALGEELIGIITEHLNS